MQFPTRVPIGFIVGAILTVAAAPLTYKSWRHFQSPLESFYLGTYLKASVMPSRTLLSGRPLLHRFYIVTVNGHDATSGTLPPTMAGLSSRFANVQPSVFAQWLRAAIYHGETPGDLIAVSLIAWASLAAVFLTAGGIFDFRRRRKAREGEQLRGPESMTVAQFNRTIPRKEKGFALRTR
jgi:hypothetical protein